jgi:hypothetical protein
MEAMGCKLRLNPTNHFLLLYSPFVRILPPFTTISIAFCDSAYRYRFSSIGGSQNETVKSQLRLRMPVHRWASCLNDIADFDGRSTAQEADSIGPVPFGSFPQEIA